MSKLVHIDFLPNFEKDDFQIIKKLLLKKRKLEPRNQDDIAKKLKCYFPHGDFYFFTSARGALAAFLKFYLSQNVRKKVLTQGYSCLVVPNSIKFSGGMPVFIDIEKNGFNLSAEDLRKKIDQDTGILIIQNTFGFPADYEKILPVAKEHNLFIIENLAHSFGAKYNGKYLGNFSDVSILSFGRSKVISSLIGGALVINNKRVSEQFKNFYETIPFPSKSWTKKQLIHGLISWQAKKYYASIGKPLMALLKKLKISSLEIEDSEKNGLMPKCRKPYLSALKMPGTRFSALKTMNRFQQTNCFQHYIAKMPNEFFVILENQIKKLEQFNRHRIEIANIYKKEGLLNYGVAPVNSEPIYLRYPMFSLKPDKIIKKLKNHNIYAGNWYQSALSPASKRLDRFGYYYGICPNAEKLALGSYNLPTNINTTVRDALLISKILKNV